MFSGSAPPHSEMGLLVTSARAAIRCSRTATRAEALLLVWLRCAGSSAAVQGQGCPDEGLRGAAATWRAQRGAGRLHRSLHTDQLRAGAANGLPHKLLVRQARPRPRAGQRRVVCACAVASARSACRLGPCPAVICCDYHSGCNWMFAGRSLRDSANSCLCCTLQVVGGAEALGRPARHDDRPRPSGAALYNLLQAHYGANQVACCTAGAVRRDRRPLPLCRSCGGASAVRATERGVTSRAPSGRG